MSIHVQTYNTISGYCTCGVVIDLILLHPIVMPHIYTCFHCLLSYIYCNVACTFCCIIIIFVNVNETVYLMLCISCDCILLCSYYTYNVSEN